LVNEDLSAALAIWRNLRGDGMDLAVHSRTFHRQFDSSLRDGVDDGSREDELPLVAS
jgi:hypothetical protein